MNVHGSKQLSFQDRKAIYRIKPRDLRYHSNNSINQYKPLILSMTRNDYIEYEKLIATGLWFDSKEEANLVRKPKNGTIS